jgi:hypothetical protein
MGGFGDWVGTVAESGSARDYRQKVSGAETVSMWQSLSFGANYKAAYCLSVCPAGEDVIGPYLADRQQFMEETLKPLREKPETIYVARGTDAEDFVPRSLPNKRVKIVRSGLPRQSSIRGFLRALPLVFQRGRSKGPAATYHFTFTGRELAEATIVIRDRTLKVMDGHHGEPDLRVIADGDTWLRFLRKEASLPWALLRREAQGLAAIAARLRPLLSVLAPAALPWSRCPPGQRTHSIARVEMKYNLEAVRAASRN